MSFKNDFMTSFESALAGEELGVQHETQTVGDEERVQTEILRDQGDELLQKTDLEESVQQASETGAAIFGVTETVAKVSEIPSAYLPSAITAVNAQLQDTAHVLGATSAPELKLDEETLEIDEVSMEGVVDWLKKAAVAFVDALKKLWNRIVVTMRRWGDYSGSVNKRIARCFQLLPRRKNPAGGNDIKLKPAFAMSLIRGTSWSEDLTGDLAEMGDVLNELSEIYKPVMGDVINEIQRELVKAGTPLNIFKQTDQLEVDIATVTRQLDETVKKHQLLLGNVGLKLRATRALTPMAQFHKVSPSAESVLRSLPPVKSLSTEAVRELMLGVQTEVDTRLKKLEGTLTAVQANIDDLNGAVARMSIGSGVVHGVVGNIASNIDGPIGLGARIAVGASHISSQADMARVQGRINNELATIFSCIDELHTEYFQRVSSVVALAEESVLQD